MIDQLDRLLTWLFATRLAKWVAMHVLHIPPEKCSMCYTRVRWAQLMLYLTKHLDGIEWLHDKRVTWRVRANPLPTNWSLNSMRRVSSWPSPSSAGDGENTHQEQAYLSDQPLLESMLSVVELVTLYGDDPPRWPPWWAPDVCTLADEYHAQLSLGSRRQYAEW